MNASAAYGFNGQLRAEPSEALMIREEVSSQAVVRLILSPNSPKAIWPAEVKHNYRSKFSYIKSYQ